MYVAGHVKPMHEVNLQQLSFVTRVLDDLSGMGSNPTVHVCVRQVASQQFASVTAVDET
jgi:hypothetical protein